MALKLIKSDFFKSFSVYTLSNIFGAGVPFLMVFVLTNILSAEEYGVFSNFQILIQLALPVVGLSFRAYIIRKYFDDGIDLPAIMGAGNIILYITAAISVVIFLLGGSWISELTFVPENWIWTAIIYAAFFQFSDTVFNLWRAEDKSVLYAYVRNSRTVIELVVSVGLVWWFQNWESRVIGQLLSFGVVAIYMFYWILKKNLIKHVWDSKQLKEIVKYGVPLIPHNLGLVAISYSDKLFVTNMIGIADNGVYSVAFQFGMIISLLQTSFNQVWQPWFYKELKKDDEGVKKKIVKITYLYSGGLIAISAIASLCAPILFALIDDEYSGGFEVFIWIAFGFAFNGVYKMMVNYLFYQEKTMRIAMLTIITAVSNIVLNYYLISINGLVGAAQATCLSFAIQMIVSWGFAQNSYKMPWFKF